jgi:DNA-binding FadR family transcriptional regulator
LPAKARQELTPLRPRKYLHEAARDTIKEYIVTNGLCGGDPLPSEGELAEELGVSRNSVREAVKALETLGIIEIRAGTGLFVKDFTFDTVLSHLAYGLTFDVRPLIEIFETRAYLEIGMAPRTVANVSPGRLAELDDCLENMRTAAEQGKYSRDEDERFHSLLFKEIGNEVVRGILNTFWKMLNIAISNTAVPPDPVDPMFSYLSHKAMADELRRGDGEGLRKATLEHFSGILQRLGGDREAWLNTYSFQLAGDRTAAPGQA